MEDTFPQAANNPWEVQLKEVGADLSGHFLLTTGRHSSRFFLLARIAERPHLLSQWSLQLAEKLKPYGVQTFVGAAVGGILPAFAMADAIGGRALYAMKQENGHMQLYPGALQPGESVILIEDAVATGSSLRKVMAAVTAQQGVVVAIGAFVHRGEPIAWDIPFHAVVKLGAPVPMWDADACPLCHAGVPLTLPKQSE